MTDAFVETLEKSYSHPKYVALTHLEFKFTNYIELIDGFIDILSTIMHLSFTSCEDIVDILDLISEYLSDVPDNFAWPNLRTLTITPFSRTLIPYATSLLHRSVLDFHWKSPGSAMPT